MGTWSDTGTSGIGQTKIVESACTAAGATLTCSISALAEQRPTVPPRQGTCTDTTFTVGGSSFAGPCRAAFGAVVKMQRTGPSTAPVCNGAEMPDGTTPQFHYVNTFGVNITMTNLTISVVNNVVTVVGDLVDANGSRIQTMRGTFAIQCRSNTHYGTWAGTFDYAF
ncbi:MAG TPA: hypothetical protein VNA20_16705 [Frankiaceae bacterium]|nr:hypothetical protein [Frankiaceae bacterium]